MRNLVLFNSALLAKQAWRLVKYPDSLVAKIMLKNKYFPKCSFMEAKGSPVSSYTWRSILSARSLLVKGLRKVIGDGRATNIWRDPWIPHLPHFRVLHSGDQPNGAAMMVSELIINGRWNREELGKWFSEWEIAEILKILIPMRVCEDRWAWHFTKNGEFAVRSAYYIDIQAKRRDRASTSMSNNLGIWKRLWNAEVPEKIKNFGWRALHNGLPVRGNLGKRGTNVDDSCPLCGEEHETITHTLLMCSEVRQMWRCSPLRIEINDVVSHSLMDWVMAKEKVIKDGEWWDHLWSILWGVWLRRNA